MARIGGVRNCSVSVGGVRSYVVALDPAVDFIMMMMMMGYNLSCR